MLGWIWCFFFFIICAVGFGVLYDNTTQEERDNKFGLVKHFYKNHFKELFFASVYICVAIYVAILGIIGFVKVLKAIFAI